MRSWKPRRPSQALRARIFAAPAAAPAETVPDVETVLPPWRWWAPVTVLMFAALTLLTGQFSVLNFESQGSEHLVATAALNQPNLVAYLPAAGHSEANAWPGTSFEWTNRGYLGARTNRVTP